MQHGGLLFSVLPYSVMVKSGQFQQWRREVMLAENTLLAVVTFPVDLFYPIGVVTVGVFIRKGIPHPHEQNVLWIRTMGDGLVKSKGKRLPNPKVPNDLETIRGTVKAFLANPLYPIPAIERFRKACPVDFGDPLLELVPENYLDQELPSPEQLRFEVEQVVRDTAAFLIKESRENDVESV